MRTRFLPVWFLAIALIGVGWWQGGHDAARAATTYYVTNNNDVGAGSLRAAVLNATDGDSVQVVTPGPITLNSTIAVTRSIMIAGPEVVVRPGAGPGLPADTGQVTIQGSNGSVFSVASGKNVVMSHLYITGGVAAGTTFSGGTGDSAFGGGIYNAGDLTLNYCTIADNKAIAGNGGNASGNGGGIAFGGGIFSSGMLTLYRSTVDNNGALGGSGGNNLAPYSQNAAYGGGIYSTGTTIIDSSAISNNTARGGNSTSGNGGSAIGGGVAQSGSGTLKLTNATIANNMAQGGSGASAGDATGGGVAVNNATLVPLNVTIALNEVSGSGTLVDSGLSYVNSSVQLTINNSIVAGNIGATDFSGVGTANQNGSVIGGSFTGTLTAANGGPTETIDTTVGQNLGDNTYSSSLSLDQRGAPRVEGGIVDAGAVEHNSVVPTNTPPIIEGFTYRIINGVANFTAEQFVDAVNYPDAGDSLQSVIFTTVPNPEDGYFELNGQKVLPGSVISVNDLDNLKFVSTDPDLSSNNSGSIDFSWQPSDGETAPPSAVTSGTPYYEPDYDPEYSYHTTTIVTDPGPPPVTETVNEPTLNVYTYPTGLVYADPGATLYFGATAGTSVVDSNGNATIKLAVYGATNNGSFESTAKTHVSLTESIGLTLNRSGLYDIDVVATNSAGNSSSFRFQFLVDFNPKFTNKSDFLTVPAITLGDTFSHQLNAQDPDYWVPNTNIRPEPLTFQLDQVCYGPVAGTCDASDTAQNIGHYTSTKLTGNLIDGPHPYTTLDTVFNWKPTKPGIYGIKVTVRDYWGATGGEFVFSLIVNPPPAPILTNPGTQVAEINAPFSLNMSEYTSGSYPGAVLTYSITGQPSWANFDNQTGTISGTPNALGTNSVTVSVTDGLSAPVSTTFDITVINGGPVIVHPTEGETVYAPVDQSFTYSIQATDPNGDSLDLIPAPVGLPAWATIGAPSTTDGVTTWDITGTPSSTASPSDVGSSAVTLSVSDGNSTKEVHFMLTVTNGNPPILNRTDAPYVLNSPYNIDTTTTTTFTHQFQALDADNPDVLTFSAMEGGSPVGSFSLETSSSSGTPVDSTFTLTGITDGTHEITVTVTDTNGNSDSETFTIVAGVGHAPTLSLSPSGPYNAITGSTIPTITATAQDADAAEDLTFSLNGAPSGMTLSDTSFTDVDASTPVQTTLIWTPTSSQAGSHTFDIVVTDSTGFQTTASVTINVTLSTVNHVPTIQNPGTQTATIGVGFSTQIVAGDPDGDAISYSATGLPGWAAISDTTGIISGTPGPGDVGTSSVTVSVTDNVNAPVSATFDLVVTGPNLPPVVTNPGTQTASVGSFFTVSIPATDPNGDTLTWTGTSLPSWATLNSTNGILSGTPTGSDVGANYVTVEVSDGVNAAVSVAFTINVSGFDIPTLNAQPLGLGDPEQVILGEGYSKIFVSHDSDYPETLTFSKSVTRIDGSGGNIADAALTTMYESGDSSNGTRAAAKFDWTPDTAGTYKVVISVKDGDGNTTSLTFSIHVSSPPKIQVNGVTTPVTLSATPEMPLAVPVAVSDPDDHETLTVDFDFGAPFSMGFSGPSTFSDVTGNTPKFTGLSYTPGLFEANSHYTFNVIVTDSAGLTATQQVTINIGPVNSRPTIISPASGSTINVVNTHEVSLPVIAVDADGDTLAYDATGLPTGLSIDHVTGIISGEVNDSGNHTVTVTVDDGKHVLPASSVTFTIAIGDASTNHDPIVDPIADQTLTIGQLANIQVSASDPDNDALTYTETGLPGWATLDTNTGIISGTPGSGDDSSSLVTITVNDGYGGTASQSFTLTVSGPFSATVTGGIGYENITYTVINTTSNTISPVVRGSLTGGGYLDNENAFFNASQGFVDDQWANPILQRKLDPTKSARILTWTVGDLAPGASATLTISVPIKGNTPNGTELTNTWSVDYGVTHLTTAPVTHD